jgi:mono/diheme cytochrome c family protein
MNEYPGARLAGLLLACCAALASGGCQSGDPRASPSPNPIAVQQGKNVYDAQCAACHEATNLHLLKDPPRLDGLFQKQALPSGAPATDAEVRDVILHGRGIMPPFELSVDNDDLQALMAYLHTR